MAWIRVSLMTGATPEVAGGTRIVASSMNAPPGERTIGYSDGVPRETGYDIAVASEVIVFQVEPGVLSIVSNCHDAIIVGSLVGFVIWYDT